ncbi:hypothetical protein [Brevibacillus marinus]|uniref:hypothetical protein n=1 Tax=Brevibacillus marinus TaxID=2496837 RepID=UPI000F83B136|nr:hypothetical protein [Brevibacillus marinus]
MKRTTRPTTIQANRAVSNEARVAQMNRITNSKAGKTGSETFKQNATKQNTSSKDQPKDRLGQAVVSFIFGIFGIILFIFSWMKIYYESSYYYSTSAGTVITSFFAYVLSVIGFILGIRARRSSSGRGLAIAAITLTAFPLVIMTLFFLTAIIGMFMLWL